VLQVHRYDMQRNALKGALQFVARKTRNVAQQPATITSVIPRSCHLHLVFRPFTMRLLTIDGHAVV